MTMTEKRNQNRMNFIKKMHSIVEHPDLERQRQSQDSIGALFGGSKEVEYRDQSIGSMDGEWVSVNRVHMKKYVILYCHGGGYMTGSYKYGRTVTTKLATSTSMDVLSFDYRLAPEHPFPGALEDAVKAWDYLMLLGYGARDVIVAGDSAGGNLALALVMKLREEGRILPRGLLLMSPWTDMTLSGDSYESRAEVDPILDRAYIERAVLSYVKSQEIKNPFVSPLYGDFCGFPPTYIQVGDNEILLSDSTNLHKRMVNANVPVKLDIYKGMWHVFQMTPFKAAYEAMDKSAEFIFDICR
ncbi:alpha/beta hydrolase [bacterium 1XD42-8]|nr:alpha/beta hydrolase [Lachnospiraceae bacterium]RKJ52604.1 alpha/beta hydrolase [bacterium 1XD42-8]